MTKDISPNNVANDAARNNTYIITKLTSVHS
jgi:hypothetical protein